MDYLKEIIFAALICGITTGVSSIWGSGSGKYIRFICGMVFLIVILSPFANKTFVNSNFINDMKNISNGAVTEEIDESIFKEMLSREICKAAVKDASEYFNVNEKSFSISIVLKGSSTEEYSIIDATVYTAGEGTKIDKTKIREHFEKILNCRIEVMQIE